MSPRLRRRILGGIAGPSSDQTTTDHGTSGVDGTVFTFAAKSLGPADPLRANFLCGSYRSATAVTISSITIGGLAATVAIEARQIASGVSAAFICNGVDTHALADTADVVITFSASAARCGFTLNRATKYASLIPTTTGQATRTNSAGSMSPNLVAPDIGFQIGAAFSSGGTNARHTSAASNNSAIAAITVDCQDDSSVWSGLSETADDVMEASASPSFMASVAAGFKYP